MEEILYKANGIDFKANELKDCPFCGNRPEIKFIGNPHTKKRSVNIKCPICRIERTDSAIWHDHEWLGKTAIKNWNQRTKQ